MSITLLLFFAYSQFSTYAYDAVASLAMVVNTTMFFTTSNPAVLIKELGDIQFLGKSVRNYFPPTVDKFERI